MKDSLINQGLHERLEPLLLFFIDGASLIDNDDLKWEVLLAVKWPQESGAKGHQVVSMGVGEGRCWRCENVRARDMSNDAFVK